MLMIFKNFKWIWVIPALAVAVLCMGCSGSNDSTTSEQGGEFTPTPEGDMEARIKALKDLLPEEVYDTITEKSRNDTRCRESNWEQLGLPDSPNGQWYYTYENLIKGMAELEEFANEGDENTRKLEIAAFLANIAQETGAGKEMDPTFGGPGCAIQEGYGSDREGCKYGGCVKNPDFVGDRCKDNDYKCPEGDVGWCGRGPHQLSWDYNYKAFGETMDKGDEYLKDPDILTKNPEIGIAGSIWFWGHADLGEGKDPEKPFKPSAHDVVVGKWEPSDKDVACGRTKADFGVIINIINGGIECGKETPTEQAKNRVKYLEAIAKEMGVTIPAGFLDDCSSQQNFAQCVSYRPTPTDPTKRCGKDWTDANSNCTPCCNTKEDCPEGYVECYGRLKNPTPFGETCSCED